jgi:hypothetical protein
MRSASKESRRIKRRPPILTAGSLPAFSNSQSVELESPQTIEASRIRRAIRSFRSERREFAPHDFGPFLLAEEAAMRRQSCANLRPCVVVAGRATWHHFLRRRLSRKFSKHFVALHADVLKVTESAGSDLAKTPYAHSVPIPANAYL